MILFPIKSSEKIFRRKKIELIGLDSVIFQAKLKEVLKNLYQTNKLRNDDSPSIVTFILLETVPYELLAIQVCNL